MTIEQLLELPTDELGKLTASDDELRTILSTYLPHTRPRRTAADLVKMTGAEGKLALAMSGKLVAQPPGKQISIKLK